KKNAIHGVPDLVVEILSPSSTFYDTVEKKEIYRKYGVQEYWVVFPGEKGIEVLILEKQGYQEFSKAGKRGIVKSKMLEGLEVDLKEVFD
ncbi:MAG: Uma2 family endonuclease, partial [Planctomycetes bacterium]|nr:Uma2 family endonuclease [Planctomycetota bacterium]